MTGKPARSFRLHISLHSAQGTTVVQTPIEQHIESAASALEFPGPEGWQFPLPFKREWRLVLLPSIQSRGFRNGKRKCETTYSSILFIDLAFHTTELWYILFSFHPFNNPRSLFRIFLSLSLFFLYIETYIFSYSHTRNFIMTKKRDSD